MARWCDTGTWRADLQHRDHRGSFKMMRIKRGWDLVLWIDISSVGIVCVRRMRIKRLALSHRDCGRLKVSVDAIYPGVHLLHFFSFCSVIDIFL